MGPCSVRELHQVGPAASSQHQGALLQPWGLSVPVCLSVFMSPARAALLPCSGMGSAPQVPPGSAPHPLLQQALALPSAVLQAGTERPGGSPLGQLGDPPGRSSEQDLLHPALLRPAGTGGCEATKQTPFLQQPRDSRGGAAASPCPPQGCRCGGELEGSAALREGLCSPPERHSSRCHPASALPEVTIMQSVPAQEGRRNRTVVVALWQKRSQIFCPSRPTCTVCPGDRVLWRSTLVWRSPQGWVEVVEGSLGRQTGVLAPWPGARPSASSSCWMQKLQKPA